MSSAVKLFLLGFAPFEKSAFESFFRVAGRRKTSYEMVSEVVQANVLLVNGANPTAIIWASTSVTEPQKALFVGAIDPTGKWPSVPRPIRLAAVLELLEQLVFADKSSQFVQLDTPEAVVNVASAFSKVSSEPVVTPEPVRRSGSIRQGSGSKDVSGFGQSNFMGLGAAPDPFSTARQFDDILVVDDSDVALKFMQNRLTRYGFRAELARSGEDALVRVMSKAYKFVFLDVMMEGLDGYQTCRSIKQRKYSSGRVPVVVMLTSRGGSIDKIRGGLAGCDAYLTKPLNEAELLKVLSKYDEQVERSFRDTNIGGSGLSSLR